MKGLISETLREYAPRYDLILTDEMLEQFELYAELLVTYNKKINLTAITEPREIAIKHFIDSLLPLQSVDIPIGASLIDIGTGAGFPGVALKSARPDIKLTLLDSLKKRTTFLELLSKDLSQDNSIIHARAEELAKNQGYRERFDFATARAVAALPVLLEYCLPFVKPGGILIALKGPGAEPEIAASSRALELLSAKIIAVKLYDLPTDSKRNVVLIKKISQTPAKYPRTAAKMTKAPL